DDVGDVPALLIEEVREVRREAGLLGPHDEAVREAAAVHAVQGAHAVLPALRELHAVPPDDLVAGAPGVVRPDLEAGGEDQAVDWVLLPRDDEAVRRHALDALPLRVDEGDVRAIEGLEVVVVEAGPLAELPVPGLERIRGGALAHDPVHARADRLHL